MTTTPHKNVLSTSQSSRESLAGGDRRYSTLAPAVPARRHRKSV